MSSDKYFVHVKDENKFYNIIKLQYTEIREVWDNRGSNFWLPLDKHRELDREDKFSLL